MHIRLFLALACLLAVLRVPSLAQPMGADQGLYAYVGERILAGDFPYRDAWDQKPPAIHYAYAAMRAVWPEEAVVAATDLLLAIVTAVLLLQLGTTLARPLVGQISALLFLLLGDPSFQRLSGVSVRAQCESFIAAATAGMLLLVSRRHTTPATLFAAGGLLGLSIAFKYNAVTYALPLLFALLVHRALTLRAAVFLCAGTATVPGVLLIVLWIGGALPDLYYATVLYNVQYSGETYAGPLQFAGYLLTFPIQQARIHALWLLGGAGCAVLLASGMHDRRRLIPVVWAAAACLSIAINSRRGLPQYFVQALPAFALAAAWGASVLWTRRRAVNILAVALAALAVWRVNEFSNLARNLRDDTRYLVGATSRAEYLARYGDRDRRKYSALGMEELADFVRSSTTAEDRILVFGFASGTYVKAERASASRFFWSRPVIVGFNAERPGYGVTGLLADLERSRPAMVALQVRDWWPDVQNSAEFFLSTPRLASWLRSRYQPVEGPDGYEIWRRRDAGP